MITKLRKTIRLFFHLLPLAFFYFELYYVFWAAFLLVLLAYIKTFKLTQAVEYHQDDDVVRPQYERALSFWKYFCFM